MGFKGSPLNNLDNGIDRPDIDCPDIHRTGVHCQDEHSLAAPIAHMFSDITEAQQAAVWQR